MLPVSGAEQLKTSRGKSDAAHFLGAQRIFHVGQPGTVELEALVDVFQRADPAA